jgi:two-component system, OmpR family, response regulator
LSVDDDDLDFTKPMAPKPTPPPEVVASARKEASSGTPQLTKSGFYVTVARYATGGRVPPRNGERHSIFVVEDDMDLLKLVGEVLTGAGFVTRFARNKAELRAEFARPPLPDLMLLDVTLPDIDGFNILQHLRSTPRVAKIPVIMMTGRSEISDLTRGLTLGADGYVTKPFKISALVAAVNTVLGLG